MNLMTPVRLDNLYTILYLNDSIWFHLLTLYMFSILHIAHSHVELCPPAFHSHPAQANTKKPKRKSGKNKSKGKDETEAAKKKEEQERKAEQKKAKQDEDKEKKRQEKQKTDALKKEQRKSNQVPWYGPWHQH